MIKWETGRGGRRRQNHIMQRKEGDWESRERDYWRGLVASPGLISRQRAQLASERQHDPRLARSRSQQVDQACICKLLLHRLVVDDIYVLYMSRSRKLRGKFNCQQAVSCCVFRRNSIDAKTPVPRGNASCVNLSSPIFASIVSHSHIHWSSKLNICTAERYIKT